LLDRRASVRYAVKRLSIEKNLRDTGSCWSQGGAHAYSNGCSASVRQSPLGKKAQGMVGLPKESRAVERFQASLLDLLGQAVIATTPEGKITYWNRVAETLYGWPQQEVIGRHLADVVFPPGQA